MRSRGCRWCYMSAARRRRRTLPRPASDASTPTPARCYSQLPVYIWVPEEEGQFQPGRCSRWWLAASLQALDADLRVRGSCGMAGGAPVGMCSCGILHRFWQPAGANSRAPLHLPPCLGTAKLYHAPPLHFLTQALGSRLLAYRSPDSRALLCRLARELGAGAVLFNHL